MVATMFRHWVNTLTEQEQFPKLRLIHVGGETVYKKDAELYKQYFSDDCILVAVLGSSEISPIRQYFVDKNTEIVGSVVPIGYAVEDIEVLLLDEQSQPVGFNQVGEIAVRSSYLCPGYWQRPDLTQAAFLPDPDGGDKLVYKTGDLGCMLPDGCLLHLGRKDFQVKVRGYRIEVAEVEMALLNTNLIREATVLALPDNLGEQHLVAYIVPFTSQQAPFIHELRHLLSESLPSYMVPSTFIRLEALPLTPTGKVDRRALPAPDSVEPEPLVNFIAPRTALEQQLAEIWSGILKRSPIGIQDNFFEIGGNSLLATQIISSIRSAFGVELPLQVLFESSTIVELSSQIKTLCPTESLLPITAIEPVSRLAELPLSFAQQRLWFLNQLAENSAAYNMTRALHLVGNLDLVALEQSLTQIVRRHEILRTTLHSLNGSPVQVIASSFTVIVQVVDLQQLPEAEQSASVQRLAAAEVQRPFDLAKGPLLRVTRLQLTQQSNVLLLVMHHIVGDNWSWGVFLGELSRLYQAFSQKEASPLPELPIQYADFAAWQCKWLSGPVLQTQLDYWKQQLAGASPILELPTDRPRPPMQTFQGSTEYFQLNQDLTQKLKTLSQHSGVTLFMTLLAALATLLSRYSSQEDIVIGSLIANRNRSEIEPLIGFFINTLVLRTQLQGNPTFSELLLRVREMTLGAYAHQDLPFEKLVEELQPERTLSHTPLFQVMFVFGNNPVGNLELPGLSITPLKVENVTAKYELTLFMEETPSGLDCSWEYNTDLFDPGTIKRLAQHFQTLLENIVANPQQRVTQLPLLSSIERHQLLVEHNDTQVEYPLEQCFPQLFEQQVELTPNAVAVVSENQQLTYSELNARANRWARHLVELGVGAETIVALVCDRNIDFLTGMLAVFKAGGAYLPLNPHHPVERNRSCLEQSQVPVVVAASEFETMVSSALTSLEGTAPQLLLIWQLEAQQHNSENLLVRSKPENLAYVIYTSGSTGKPKGAMLEHRGMLNHLYAKVEDLKLSATDVVAQTSSVTFDISIWQFLAVLLVGGRVEIVSNSLVADPQQLLLLVERQQISILEIVPSLLRMMLQEIELNAKPKLSELRWLLLTGETLPPQLCRQWLEYYPTIPMMNAYGPTECSDDVTHYPIYQPPAPEILNLPIGRPVSNTQLYVLDTQLQPVPIGVIGELYVGGVGVGRGYLNNPQLTQKVFIDDPFAQKAAARLYKTGDKARTLADGNIEFLGRIDYQVKIRGFRIELGEIEAVLSQHPSVREAVVIDRQEQAANPHLVAYIVPKLDLAVTTTELREFLKVKLPEYMVPSAFVMLELIPLTPNGKVDRRALPAPDMVLSLTTNLVAPRDPLELQLTQIWEEVLHVHPVGVRDNFFDLGGHSLLAVCLMAAIQQRFGKNLPLATLFGSPTIEQLATILRKHSDSSVWSPLVAIQPDGSRRPFFCIPGIGGNVIYFYDLARHLGLDQPFYALQALGLDVESPPHTRIEDMADYYIQAIQTVQPQGPYLLGGHSFGGKVAFEMSQQLLLQGHEVALLALIDSTAPIPGHKPIGINWDNARWLTEIASRLERLLAKNLGVLYETLQLLDSSEQLNYLLQRLKMVNFLPPEAGTRQLSGLVQVFKANAQTHYQPQQVYPTRITLLRASEVVSKEAENDIHSEILQDSAWGWSEFSNEPVDVYFLPGDHFTMMTEPHVRVLAERLGACLKQSGKMS
jgi:amino acid adenylation domain-containing protein